MTRTLIRVRRLLRQCQEQRGRVLVCVRVLIFGFYAMVFCLQSEGQVIVSKSAAKPSSPAKGSINGRVLGEDGQPIANAWVSAIASEKTPTGTRSDIDGKFRLEGLQARAYTLFVYSAGLYDSSRLEYESGRPTYYRPGDTVTIRMVKGGVITGKVTASTGEPVIRVPVKILRVHDLQGKPFPLKSPATVSGQKTDDRGIYRYYGLLPGRYVVFAGGSAFYNFQLSPYDADVPTYYPSSTRDTAAEVTVQEGQEVGEVDIRYRAESGHAVGGTVTGQQTNKDWTTVSLRAEPTKENVASTRLFASEGRGGFSFEGLRDGDYDLVAERKDKLMGATLRVNVRGADVTGLRLNLAPLGSVMGRVVLEEQPNISATRLECVSRKETAPQETMILLHRDETPRAVGVPSNDAETYEGTPQIKDEFAIHGLAAGRYHLEVKLPGKGYYLSSVVMGNSARATTKDTDPLRAGIRVAAGKESSGLTVILAPGAASLRGQITAEAGGKALFDSLRVYLVPTERERINDVLRYSEAPVHHDGAFVFENLAPGKYFVLALSSPGSTPETGEQPSAWNDEARSTLRRQAESANNTLKLEPCQRTTGYILRTISDRNASIGSRN